MVLETVKEAVLRASQYAKRRVGNVGEIELKGPRDFVTEVDKAAEKIIIDTIEREYPDARFLGEETGLSGGDGRYLFVIDPLDGTTNYIKGLPLWDVSVGVYDGDVLVAGVISHPSVDDLYVGEIGKGVTVNGNPIHVSDVSDLGEAVILWNRSNHPDEIRDRSAAIRNRLFLNGNTDRQYGTGGLDHCFLARGSVDGLVCPLAEEVHIAGIPIMLEAGATVTDYEGKAVTLDSKTIVAANPALHSQLLEVVRI